MIIDIFVHPFARHKIVSLVKPGNIEGTYVFFPSNKTKNVHLNYNNCNFNSYMLEYSPSPSHLI